MKYKIGESARPVKTVDDSPAAEIPISDISVARLIDSGLLALHREMHNLLKSSAAGKLGAADARDLRDTIKLLFELKDREKALLDQLTTEDLVKLNENKNDN